MQGRRAILVSLIATLAVAGPPARAAGSAPVTLRIASYTYALADEECSVTVAQGANGAAVLSAAVSKGCIRGFTAHQTSLGNYLDCIDDGRNGNRCGDPYPTFLRFWAMRENCTVTDYGIDGFSAAPGDELSFTYETVATLFVPAFKPENPPNC
jgi:hypothetical protein